MPFKYKYVLATHRKDSNQWILLFFVFFIIGVLLLHFMDGNHMMKESLINNEVILKLQQIKINRSAYFFFVLKERVFFMLTMLLLSTTVLGKFIPECYLIWYGTSLGMMLSSLTTQYGVKGLFFYLVCAFPQYIFYIPVTFLFLAMCYKVYGYFYQKETQRFTKYDVIRWAIILVIEFFAILLEVYCNPILVSKMVLLF